MRGIKKVAGLTQRYCDKDGYGLQVQGIYDPEEDKIYGLVQIRGSWLNPPIRSNIRVVYQTRFNGAS